MLSWIDTGKVGPVKQCTEATVMSTTVASHPLCKCHTAADDALIAGCVASCFHRSAALDQSRRHEEALLGSPPPNKAPSPPNWNLKYYKSMEFLSNFNVKPPYWRLSGDGSALDTSEPGWLALKLPELIVSRKGTLCVIANSHSLLWKFRPSARGFNLHALGCVLVAAVVVYSSAAALVSR